MFPFTASVYCKLSANRSEHVSILILCIRRLFPRREFVGIEIACAWVANSGENLLDQCSNSPRSSDRPSESVSVFGLVCSLLKSRCETCVEKQGKQESPMQNSKVKIMKRAFLIVISALALAGLLLAEIAWPKASIAEETPAAAPAAEATSPAKDATNTAPKEANAETSGGASQGTKAEEASTQNKQGSAEAASEHDDEQTATTSASAAEASDEKEESSEEDASDDNDEPAAGKNASPSNEN